MLLKFWICVTQATKGRHTLMDTSSFWYLMVVHVSDFVEVWPCLTT